MSEFKIIIPARKREYADKQQIVRLTPEAYNMVVDIFNESTLSLKEIASLLIQEAAKHVEYSKEELE